MLFSEFAQNLKLSLECKDAKHNIVDGKTPFEYNVVVKHGQNKRMYTTKYTKGAAYVRYGMNDNRVSYMQLKKLIQNEISFLHPIPPNLSEVLESLQLDCQSFDDYPLWEDFASNLSCNVDSIKDKKVFKACRKTYAELKKFFGVDFQTFLSCVSE